MWLGAFHVYLQHYLSSICLWKLENLEYGGLCSHLPLIDLVQDTVKYKEALTSSPEELAQIIAKQQAPAVQIAKKKVEQKAIPEENAQKAAIAVEKKAQKTAMTAKKAQKASENEARFIQYADMAADLRVAPLERITAGLPPQMTYKQAHLRAAAPERIAASMPDMPQKLEMPQKKRKSESELMPKERERMKSAKRQPTKPGWQPKKLQ